MGITRQFSQWWEVSTGIPERSLVGLVFLNLFTNDLEVKASNEVSDHICGVEFTVKINTWLISIGEGSV